MKLHVSSLMSDYLQPDFYRFNQDSVLLVNEVAMAGKKGLLLDIGAGSGIIGIELALKLELPEVHFLELQDEWRPVLEENIRKFIPQLKPRSFWTSLGEWKPEAKYDLIVGNPPYYLPGQGRLSPDPVRAKCRSFEIDGWEVLLKKALEALNEDGLAWFITPKENISSIRKCGVEFECLERGELSLIRLDKNRSEK